MVVVNFILQKGLPFLYGFFHLHKIFYTLKEETALIYEEIEMIHKIENIRTIPNYIEAKIFFHH
ncbi:hypothetical protein CYQ56_09820 [Enterococcus faecium]|nr:hypothetical protein CYQ12_10180 [Enterococcus faecium]RXW53836.1 hypothetical protein CYQ76_09970 [Enterococcus faecium]RXW71618.1 hypothetical protein CYQ68_09850 [Enterococcus faecium]RXW88009.1 hypothetical protein CYQ61_10010 [Enterococcus faecium]RXX02458.1 hypothetical protein CYQ56_09820 [Enterococcus faecium]